MRRSDSSSRFYGLVATGIVLSAIAIMGQGCPNVSPPVDQEPGVDSGLTGNYAGSTECFICHANVHQDWSQTRHAEAYQSLVNLGQQNNTVCLNCHTTGFGEAGGFVDAVTTQSLAHVGCEACHGPSGPHRHNVADRSLRPPKSIAAEVCSRCHNSFHHDLYTQWASSKHHEVNEDTAASFTQGRSLNTCGTCHSGDFRAELLIGEKEIVSDTLLQGVPHDQMNGITCSICHDPHARTNNALNPPAGHDYQLRYPEVKEVLASNDVDDATNPDRFNHCGQCHHSRGRTWVDTARGPHHSVQANFYVGEMPVPEGQPLLVPNTRTVHRFVMKQCVTCHMQPVAPLVNIGVDEHHANHGFRVTSTQNCSSSGCHPTPESATADMTALQTSVQADLEAIAARLGTPSSWEYSAEGGPPAAAQTSLPEQIRKVRFMYKYILSDGSLGVHNPEYTRAMLREMDVLLDQINR